MADLSKRRILGDEASALRMTFPAPWARVLGLKPGQTVEVLFDDILVVIPRPGPQADRVRKAMAEVG